MYSRILPSSQSGESSSSDSEDGLHHVHPQNLSNTMTGNNVANTPTSPPQQAQWDTDHSSRSSSPTLVPQDASSFRSRSPVIKPLSPNPQATKRTISPNAPARSRPHIHHSVRQFLLPNSFCVTVPFPWGRRTVKASGDVRKAGENIILLLSLLYGIEKTWDSPGNSDNWISFGEFVVAAKTIKAGLT